MCEWRTIARSPTVRSATPSPLMTGCSSALPRSTLAYRQEVQPAIEVARPQAEVGGADRRHEALVERLRDPECPVDAVPAEPDRQLVGAELASVEETEELDGAEVRLDHPAGLPAAGLGQAPRGAGPLRAP